ncbi:villin-1-like protein [Leptotrombidium deliense]|uniref:Villin-1-like protein n=1 Tax=Leptotrombidium deliense TaxID=299467 RepID=A0A443SA41_9ACAR|nr:villin-1-like protein [Leptotrombidium deliense]
MSSEITVDPAFEAIPKNSTFFLIWRIEKLKLVLVPKETYGTFYNGDSYIIAGATDGSEKIDSQMTPQPAKNKLDIHIHFWLGENTSQDEAGIAAYKSVELDDYFGGFPVQHRETQGHESNRFLSYFKNGIRLLDGGVESGFNHVDDEPQPRLFHVKGKRKAVVKQCRQIGWSSMNKGDVFILDIVKYVFLWTGRSSNYFEKIQGAKVAQQIKNEHGLKCKGVIVVEDGNETVNLRGDEKEIFQTFLPLNKKGDDLKEETSDADEEQKRRTQLTLYQCTDADGSLKLIELKRGSLCQEDLISDQDAFIVDNGENGIWVWIGKNSNKDERVAAMKIAQAFITAKKYPPHTQVSRIIDGAEPIEFKSLFKVWKNVGDVYGPSKTYSVGGRIANMNEIAKQMADKKVDFDSLHKNQSLAAKMQLIDNGDGEKKVYRVKGFDVINVDTADYGTFYSGDCYIVVYKPKRRSDVLIYYWIGNGASVDEKGTVALKTREMDEKQFGGRAVQVRVAEGKEPPQFTSIFGGQMVILKGGFKSALRKGKKEVVEEGVHGEKYLLNVRGTNKYITRAVEVDCIASSLNSNDCFVLFTPNIVYVWYGKGSTDNEKEMAKVCSSKVDREVMIFNEGQESLKFWDELGGRKEYTSDQNLQVADLHHSLRLFQCSNAKGYFTVEEIVDFQQCDLIEDDVMLLDAWDYIFLWIGNKSNDEERKQAMKTAEEYLRTDPRDRDLETPIIVVKQGYEPANFTGFFGVWDANMWSSENSFDALKAEIAQRKLEVTKL